MLRAASYASPMAAFQDGMAGIAYYQFIEKLDREFDDRKEEIIENLRVSDGRDPSSGKSLYQLYRRERVP